ncbi:MAG: hypothetical protein JJT94_01895, partial [Bernardetiaceae bacterium]|nr:hypothetical protein [Bernardetiaceae bacterium]
PFGMAIHSRSWQSEGYRFGFNGKEDDNDVGDIQDYGFRIYNKAIARFLSVDPLAPDYPWNSTYCFAENSPVAFIDLEGLERFFAVTIGYDIKYRGRLLSTNHKDVVPFHIVSGQIVSSNLVNILKEATQNNNSEGIGFIALFSHGTEGNIFGKEGYSNRMSVWDFNSLEENIHEKNIVFDKKAIIYLGGCNGGSGLCDGVDITSFA